MNVCISYDSDLFVLYYIYFTSSNSGFATPYVYGSYGESVARIDALAAGLEKGGEQLLDKNKDGMLLVRLF